MADPTDRMSAVLVNSQNHTIHQTPEGAWQQRPESFNAYQPRFPAESDSSNQADTTITIGLTVLRLVQFDRRVPFPCGHHLMFQHPTQ